jgi:ATP-dependent exoDNAse (exonuclease V) beta subunit
MAAGALDQVEEERRVLYVALTRARQHLTLVQP